jgi:PAS domain S-box-containing protein
LRRANGAEVAVARSESTASQLESNRRFLEAILDSIGDPIFVKDRDHRYIYVNEAKCKLTGHPREAILGKTDYAFSPPEKEQVDIFVRKDEVVFETGEENINEEALTGADGILRTVLTTKTLYVDDAGRRRVVGIIRDITQQKRAEEALKRSQAAYLAEAQKLSHTGSFGWNVSNGALFWSEETFRIFEYEPETKPTVEIVLNRVHPDDVAFVRQVIDRASSEKQDFDIEHRLLMPDGSVKYVQVVAHASSDTSGGTEFIGAVMDVTAAKEAKNKIQMIIDTVPALIWTAKPDGTLDFVSQRLLHYQGLTREEKLERGWGAQIHPDEIDQVRGKWRVAVAEGKPFEAEIRLRRFDGEYRWFLYRAVPLRDRSGRSLGWYGNNLDIHDGKQAAEALRQAQADLARVSRLTTMGELTASLAHEVNQPIGAAVTNAESCLSWLACDPPNLEEARIAATNIVNNGIRAAEIITRIRRLFKKDISQRELVDVNEVIREIVVLLRSEAMRYSILIHTELAEDLPAVMGDCVQLQQVVMNLISNSIDAMKDVDGTRKLDITSRRTEEEQVVVSVRDTGVGLPALQSDQIFNAFFTTKVHGTGLGLSISRSIIEAHGGRLWAADNFPRGASFHLTLPTEIGVHD